MIVRLVSALDPVVPVIVFNRLDKRVVSAKLRHTSFYLLSIVIHDLIGRGKGRIWISAPHDDWSLFSEGLSHTWFLAVFYWGWAQQWVIDSLILLLWLQLIPHHEVRRDLVQPSLPWIQSRLWARNFPSIGRGQVICTKVHRRVLAHCEMSGPKGIACLLTFVCGDKSAALLLAVLDCPSQLYVCHCSFFEE